MDISKQTLSDIVVYMKYAKYLPDKKRRETWSEIVLRNKEMHKRRYPELSDEIDQAYELVETKKILPSMRSLQFGGPAIEKNPVKLYNCSAVAMDDPKAFSEVMFLLLSGTGVGWSVQKHHIKKLPPVKEPIRPKDGRHRKKRYLIPDSIEGWADAVKMLVNSYFNGNKEIEFDYRDIRPKGSLLVTSGGRAPGPEPLHDALHNIRKIFERVLEERGTNSKLKSIEIHDMLCHISDCVLSGGVRRSAGISMFSFNDEEMLTSKFGNWWETNPQRARANNSVIMLRHKAKREDFDYIWERVKASGAGEPGILFSNSQEVLVNPCAEISLKSKAFCNLVEVNVSDIESQEDLNNRARWASFINTLQAGYTDFHYLREDWQENSDKEALLGVSMTGIASGNILDYDIKQAARSVVEENARVSKMIGVNPSYRMTTVKPSGTASTVLGCSSGIHAWHSPYYIRRIRVGKDEPIYKYLVKNNPEIVEDEFFNPSNQAVISLPIKAPDNAIFRTESPLELLARVKRIYTDWILEGHRKGNNTHNVSVTVSIKDDEWGIIGDWMWENRDYYNGISVLPFDGGSYTQAPFEECLRGKYEELLGHVRGIDLTKIKEYQDMTDLQGEVACAGGACELK